MFVNQVLFRHENVASDVLYSLNFNRKIAKSLMKLSNSGLQKALNSSKFWIFSNMLTSSTFLVKFQCFHRKIIESMFFHQKTLINTKYKCQKKEKVEHENSVKIQ